MKNYTFSKEGLNFDKLANNVIYWQRIDHQNFYVSEIFRHNDLYLQLLKSYDRVVGLIDRKENEVPIVIKLGQWGATTSCQITKFARKNNYPVFDVMLFSDKFIKQLQTGLI